MEKPQATFPGFCDTEQRQLLTSIIESSLSHQWISNSKENRYWYPMSTPTYGSDEVLNALDSLLRMETTMGRKVRDFESSFASMVGAKHAIMVNSGSSADLLACFVCVMPGCEKLHAGDEILIPALTWPTQIWSAVMAGLNVKTIDVDPSTLNTTAEMIENAIGPKTKALFLVHLMGNPCDMDSIMQVCQRHNLILLEDCCESLCALYDGKHVGTFGLVGAFSFFFSHHLVTMEGGMLVTNDDQVADRLRVLRAHGWSREMKNKVQATPGRDARFQFVNWGFNVRPTELQGAFGQVQLKRQHEFAASRNDKFRQMETFLSAFPELSLPKWHPKAQPCWMFLPITVKRNSKFTRQQLVAHLEANGVETRPVVIGDLKKQPAAEHFQFLRNGSTPGAEFIDDQSFLIGLHPRITFKKYSNSDDHIERLQTLLREYLSTKGE
uniref:DegT/DnrJ/EryC1/StrS aminotransferase family protein n=1 Tax=Trichuris muris TaxID=70415 RepID=A0A5S6R537_TRIMR